MYWYRYARDRDGRAVDHRDCNRHGVYDNFLTGQVLANVLIRSHLIVLAVGRPHHPDRSIDLSVGAVVALSAMIASRLLASG
jgi:ribose/xylose/arabinose/galactoside ABC-type transport system permease subunit